MNVAGPSRVRPSGRLASRGRVESTYEDDLLGLLNHLSLDEMDEIQSFFTLRTRAGHPLSDHDIAMNDLLQQSRALAVLNQDRALAQRIATGEDVTGQTPEQRPVPAVPQPNDNGTAAQQNDRQQHPERPDARTPPSQTWGGWLSSVVDWVCGTEPVSELLPTNTGTAVPRIPVVNRRTGHDCVICQDPIYGAEIRAPCGHYYGIDCITDLFQSATRDETLFPPRCCRQNIPFAQVQLHLSQELITTFQQKQVEFSTLKRVYCSSPQCSRFLGPISEGFFDSKVYTCPAPGCGRRTCGRCREQHSGNWAHTCRPDTDAAQVLELGRASGWARCPGCSQLIELHIGCFHMTCRCRTEFCYLCRARWKTCPCPQWDERRLTVAAEERVDAQLGAGRARGARRVVPPVPVPNPIVIPANRAPAPAPAPAPVPAQRPVPARPVAPRPLAPGVETRHPPPIPARTPTTSSWTVRPASTASTPLREETNHTWRSRLAAASTTPTNTGTAAQASASGWRSSMASVTTSGVASGSASTSASVSSSASGSGWRARMASEPEWRVRMASTTTSGLASGSASTSASASSSASPTALASGSGWRARMASTTTSGLASGSTLTKTSTSASTPFATRPKSIQNDNIDQMRQRLVHEMMDRLREDHDCDHTRWRYRHGGGVCQTCGHHLPLYLFQCHGCEMLACKRCKCNRL